MCTDPGLHVQLRKGVDYRNLVEPLDCANWYRLGIDLQELAPNVLKVCRQTTPP